ncbi:MAG: hypothetical protein RL094_757 [Candidatus Parcubacteria bacterium]|jgi:hypothetical protein
MEPNAQQTPAVEPQPTPVAPTPAPSPAATQVPTSSPTPALTPEQAAFVKRFSWAAIFFQPIYFFATHLIVPGILMCIPFVNIYFYFKGVFRGRKMSWETGEWKDFAQFEKRQRLLDKIALIFVGIWLLLMVTFVATAGVSLFQATKGAGSPSVVAEKFMTDVSTGNIHEAFVESSDMFKDHGTEEDFVEYANGRFAGATSTSFNSVQIKNNDAVVCGSFVTPDGEEAPILIQLSKESDHEGKDSSWRVDGFDLSEDAVCEV